MKLFSQVTNSVRPMTQSSLQQKSCQWGMTVSLTRHLGQKWREVRSTWPFDANDQVHSGPDRPIESYSQTFIGQRQLSTTKRRSETNSQLHVNESSTALKHWRGWQHNQPIYFWRRCVTGRGHHICWIVCARWKLDEVPCHKCQDRNERGDVSWSIMRSCVHKH